MNLDSEVLNSSVAGFVLAGGRSSRMGTDKALVALNGRPLVVRMIDIFKEAGLACAIAGARSDLGEFGPVLSDEEPDAGPLGGICSALASNETEWSIFLSVDQPFVPPSVIRYLAWHAQITDDPVVLFSINGYPQTFPVALHRRVLPALREQLWTGNRSCWKAFRLAAASEERPLTVLAAEFLMQAGHFKDCEGLMPMRWFANLNTPEDLERVSSTIA